MLPLTRSRNRSRFFGIPFSPSTLFQGGTVAGAWYDPSDLSTMFTTSAGTTPVAMPGQGAAVPVGLMLDKSQGLVLGSELVTNGDFSSGTTTGWTATNNATLTVVSGRLRVAIDGITNYGAAVFAFATVVGQNYRVAAQGFKGTNSSFWITKANSPTNFGVGRVDFVSSSSVDAEVFCGIFTATASTSYLWLFNNTGSAGQYTDFDNISVRELPGNHAISFNNTTARPELRARVNLLTYSEQFDNGAWTPNNVTITPNTTVAPDGTLTGDKLVGTGNNPFINQSVTVTAQSYTVSCFAKAGELSWFRITWITNVSNTAWFNLATGATGTIRNGTASMTPVGNGWYRCVYTFTASAVTNSVIIGCSNADDATTGYTGDGTSGIYIWGADLRPANIGANVPAYQRIADANTYDTSGFPLYLLFEGAVGQRGMYTPASIPFATVTSDGQARRNLLTFPTAFDDAAWTKLNVTIAANSTTAPDGTTSADTMTGAAGTLLKAVFAGSLTNSGTNTFSIYVKSSAQRYFQISRSGNATDYANFDIQSPQATAYGATTASIVDAGNGWYRCVVVFPSLSNSSMFFAYADSLAFARQDVTASTNSSFIWGAQLETGSTVTAFQNIGTDKVAVFAGVRKLSDAAIGTITELSANASTTNGTFQLRGPATNGAQNYYATVSGTSVAEYLPATFAAPITNVVSSIMDIAGASISTELIPRVNGVVEQDSPFGTAGTGNFGTHPLFIGSRNNGSFWFNGHLHSLIIAGSAVSAGNISATEQWVAGRTGIQI